MKKILFVEGKDEDKFFGALFKEMGIHGVEIIVVEGKDKFSKKIPSVILGSEYYDNILSIGIVRDADGDFRAAFSSIKGILDKLRMQYEDLDIPNKSGVFTSGKVKVGIFVMPGSSEGDMLEDLCLSTVKNTPKGVLALEFIENAYCLGGCSGNKAKAKIQAYLSIQNEIVSSIGLAAEKHFWDFSHSGFGELKEFVGKFR